VSPPLHAEFVQVRVRILPRECHRQLGTSMAGVDCSAMQLPHPLEMPLQRIHRNIRQDSDTILAAFGIADQQTLVLEVDVLDP